jgi:hypothetical protein
MMLRCLIVLSCFILLAWPQAVPAALPEIFYIRNLSGETLKCELGAAPNFTNAVSAVIRPRGEWGIRGRSDITNIYVRCAPPVPNAVARLQREVRYAFYKHPTSRQIAVRRIQ